MKELKKDAPHGVWVGAVIFLIVMVVGSSIISPEIYKATGSFYYAAFVGVIGVVVGCGPICGFAVLKHLKELEKRMAKLENL